MLQRSEAKIFEDTDEATVRQWIGMYVSGSPEKALRELESWASDRLRQPTYCEHVAGFLCQTGFRLRPLAHDDRIPPKVESLQDRFRRQLQPILAGGRLIPRPQTEKILASLSEQRVFMVHGDAGSGKSGVLYELTESLAQRGVPYLPVRLDRQATGSTTEELGEKLGLPASPAHCLHAVAGDRQSVLVLDQLDALRWTSAHSRQGLDVVRELIQELHELAPKARVVLACRSFDLEHDPQLRAWKGGETRIHEVRVEELSEEQVREAVEQTGRSFYELEVRERELLRNVYHLSLWLELVERTGGAPRFQTSLGLLRRFWENRYDELEKQRVPIARAQVILRGLADYMDRKARVTAPRRRSGASKNELEALQSLHILTVMADQVSFRHQSHRDYLVAERLQAELDEQGRSVLDWLGEPAKQALFRREQLRLVLAFLREERLEEFPHVVREMLGSQRVRFHLKQVVLQVLGRIDDPREPEIGLVLELVAQEEWRTHVVEEALRGSVPWFEALEDREVLSGWLAGADEEMRDTALRLLERVAERSGDRVAKLLEPYEDADKEWQERCATVLVNADVEQDSAALFELRLRMIERNWPAHCPIRWSELARQDFPRFVRLYCQLLQLEVRQRMERLQNRKSLSPRVASEWLDLDEQLELREVELTEIAAWWPVLSRAVELFLRCSDRRYRSSAEAPPYWDASDHREHIAALRQIAVEILCRDWRWLFAVLKKHSSESPLLEVTALDALAAAPGDQELADFALLWIMVEPQRLHLRYGTNESPWTLSRRALNHLSQYCSNGILALLECVLLEFREPDLLEMFKYRRRLLDEADAGDPKRWRFLSDKSSSVAGLTPCHLLPALGDQRRSPASTAHLRQLGRKFGPNPPSGERSIQVGAVGSPLGADVRRRLSDQRWLQIISSPNIVDGRGPWNWQAQAERFEESSVRTFAADLQMATQAQPERFARLALKIPGTAPPEYIRAILQGLPHPVAPQALSDSEKGGWVSAEWQTLEQVLRLPAAWSDEGASAFCRVLEAHAALPWSAEILERLAQIARRHPDPSIGAGGSSFQDDLDSWALNCTRGAAGYAVCSILLKQPNRLAELDHAVAALVADAHPAVRVAGIAVCQAVLLTDEDQASRWFQEGCAETEIVLESTAVLRFLQMALPKHRASLLEIIERMVSSNVDEVMARGASAVTHCWLMVGDFESLFRRILTGKPAQRLGVARLACGFLQSDEYRPAAERLLVDLADDEDLEVRRQVADAFRHVPMKSFAPDSPFFTHFPRSRAMETAPDLYLQKLKDYPGSLLPIAEPVLEAGRFFAGALAAKARDPQSRISWSTRHLVSLLLRLYDESASKDPQRHQECLDVWDRLLEARVPQAELLTRQLDSDSWGRT